MESTRYLLKSLKDDLSGGNEIPRDFFVTDGNNVAWDSVMDGVPSLENIQLMLDKLEALGSGNIMVVSAGLKYEIDNSAGLKRLIRIGRIQESPARTDSDFFILALAREFQAKPVSNDLYREHRDRFTPEIERRVAFIIAKEELTGGVIKKVVILYDYPPAGSNTGQTIETDLFTESDDSIDLAEEFYGRNERGNRKE